MGEEEMTVLIEKDESSEMLRISKDGVILWTGNWWDWQIHDISELLIDCGVDVEVDEFWEYEE